MQQLISQYKQQTTNKVELTGNVFVDNGLAVVAALSGCKNIEDLTLRKMKILHDDGIKLARNNMKLKANYMVFINSITTQPSYSEKDKIKKYAKITTAILNNIGHEEINEFCDFCGNPYSVDLTKLFHENIKVKKKKRADKTKKRKLKPVEPEKHFIGRDWFPLIGSMGSDAQALPGASRPLNSCAKCLFAVQYLPQASILVNKLLSLFQSTSMTFWYQWVKNLAVDIRKKLAARSRDKVETLGKKEGNGEAVNRLLEVMRNSKSYDPNVSMIMWQYSNGKSADLKNQLIPNFALNFLHEAAIEGIDKDIKELTDREGKKTSYKYSFLNCIAEQQDYYPLYPSEKSDGASPQLFLLYQTYILKHPVKSLYTAYKIAQYVKSKLDVNKIVVDINRNPKKQATVRKWIIEMAKEGLITFDEYYDLFVRPHLDRRNPWQLVKYYMLSDNTTEFKNIELNGGYNQEYKDRVIKVGTMIFDRYIEEKGRPRLVKLLGKFARGDIHANWLRTQFEQLADIDDNFDYSENWEALCVNKQGEEDIYGLLYLFRLLFTNLNRIMLV